MLLEAAPGSMSRAGLGVNFVLINCVNCVFGR